jgi:hypothetical protein
MFAPMPKTEVRKAQHLQAIQFVFHLEKEQPFSELAWAHTTRQVTLVLGDMKPN